MLSLVPNFIPTGLYPLGRSGLLKFFLPSAAFSLEFNNLKFPLRKPVSPAYSDSFCSMYYFCYFASCCPFSRSSCKGAQSLIPCCYSWVGSKAGCSPYCHSGMRLNPVSVTIFAGIFASATNTSYSFNLVIPGSYLFSAWVVFLFSKSPFAVP